MDRVLSCFCPATVVVVDDNVNFLESMVGCISSDKFVLKCFSDPIKAANYINQTEPFHALKISDIVSAQYLPGVENQSPVINIQNISSVVYDPERFRRISVVLSDYFMPNMTGLEFFSRLKVSNVQKVLLTGMADNQVAINAFNKGQIQGFLNKNGTDFSDRIVSMINVCLKRYYDFFTTSLVERYANNKEMVLNDPIFANFFTSLLSAISPVEYYLTDPCGSFMFVSDTGQVYLLDVVTESEMATIVKLGEDSGEADPKVLAALQSRESILVTRNMDGKLPPVKDWHRYLKPAKSLIGYSTYYFHLDEHANTDERFHTIQGFKQYKKKVGSEAIDSCE